MKTANAKDKVILVTGAAGFIGAAFCQRLLSEEESSLIIGIDNLNDSYDVSLKKHRLDALKKNAGFLFLKGDISDRDFLSSVFAQYHPQAVVHLAAQAGIRNSITNPESCISSNILGFFNILEGCRSHPVKHLVYASSSSVYGDKGKVPFTLNDRTDTPVSLYAATKKSNELMAYAYSKLYEIPCTGLRFFTVYGPEGRPDMAYFSFADKLRNHQKIQLYNYGKCERDFTYIDDVVEGLVRVIKNPPKTWKSENGQVNPPFALYNMGNQDARNLKEMVDILHRELVNFGVLDADFDLQSYVELVPKQPGDAEATLSDTTEFAEAFGFRPATPLCTGLHKFVEWYKQYYIDRDHQ